MPPKAKKKSAEEEEKARLEEEERLRIEREEEERRAKEQARKERLDALKQSLLETRFDNESRLVGSFNNYLLEKQDEVEQRKQSETWDRWLDQSGRPDMLSAKSVASFVTRCTESTATEESILSEFKLANDLIADIKSLSLDYPHLSSHFVAAINQLNEMKERRVDQLTLELLKSPKDYLDPVSDDLIHEFNDEKSGLRFMVWANASKNTRRRKVEFEVEQQLVRVELTKQQCKDDAGLRVYYTNDDTHQAPMPEILEPEPLEPPAEVEIKEEEEEVNEDENGEQEENKEENVEPQEDEKSVAAKSAKSGTAAPPSQKGQLDNVDDFEVETVKMEKTGLDGMAGIGGVWHVDFLAAPEAPRKQGNWTIKRHYTDELAKVPLRAEHQPNQSIEMALPKPKNAPENVPLAVGIWNKLEQKWESENIVISEEKDGSIFFTTQNVGDFKFFVDRHSNGDAPLIDTWLLRPNGDDVELHLILQNYRLLFTIHEDGTVTLAEQHEPKVLKMPRERVKLEALLLDMEEESLFVFPTAETLPFLDVINKDEYVVNRAYQNMCSIAHLAELRMSQYNPTLENNRLAILSNEKTVLCDEEKFYVIEDKYIPPDPPVCPSATSVEESEADDAYKEELEKYEAKIAEEAANFEPDFEIPREGESMEATLDMCLKCTTRINEQNLSVFKLLMKSKVFNF